MKISRFITLFFMLVSSLSFAQTYELVASTPFDGVSQGSMAFADIDNDGDQDVFITGRTDALVSIAKMYKNDGAGNYTLQAGTPFPVVYESNVNFADIDNDGDQDLLITGRNITNNRIAELYNNDGAGNYSLNNSTLVGVKAGSSAFADLNQDGFVDMVIAGMEPNNTYMTRVYINTGSPFFVESYNVGWSAGLQGIAYGSIALADIDDDNDPDLLVAGQEGVTFGAVTKFYSNNGSGFTEIAHPFDTGFNPSLAFLDVENDGDQDLVMTANSPSSGGAVADIFLNNASGVFTHRQSLTLAKASIGSIAVDDVNNDSYPDILITGAKSTGQRIAQLYANNNGAGTFGSFTTILGGVYNSSIGFADIDGNATIDVLITGQNSSNARVSQLYKNISCFDVTTSIAVTACGSYTVPSGATTYTTPGNYIVNDTKLAVTYCGADSILTIDLTLYENLDYNVTQTGPNPICSGTTTIELSGSETGMNYYLREGTNIVDGPIVGDGNALSFTTPSISTSTTYNVFADAVACSHQMTQTVTVDVDPIPEATLSETSSQIICSGSATIEASSSEISLDYYLRDTNNIIIDGPIVGTGSNISFSTNEIDQATTYNVVAKKKGYALDFDGVDDYAGIALASGLPTGGVITIEAWVKRREYRWSRIVYYGSPISTCYERASMALSEEGRPSWSNGCNGISDMSGPTKKINEWGHLAVVMNGTGVRMYMDGNEFLGSIPLTPTLVNGVLEIGRVANSSQYFSGEIDEVRIWNTARTKQEIRDNAFAELAGNEAGLVAYFNMEDGVGGSTIIDVTGNGNNLMMYNMDPTTDWVTGLGTCDQEFPQTVTVTVDPIPEVTLSETSNPIICSGAAKIETSSSEAGVDYYLREGINIVDGPITGDGSGVAFTTPEISSASTYNVQANKANPAIYFDGIDDGMDVRNVNQIGFGGYVDVTISLWVKPASTQNDDCSLIQTSVGEARGFKIVQNGNNVNEYYFAFATGAGFTGTSILSQLASNQWQQFTVVKEGSTITHYLNGVQTATGIASSTSIYGPTHDYLRFGIGDGIAGFKGGIDETAIWRTALSPTQVANLYNSGIPEEGTVSYWKMNEGSGNAVTENELSQNYNATMFAMDPATSWGNGPILPSLCSHQMAQTVTVDIDPLPAFTISETSDPIICSGNATIETPSESNIAYFLRNSIDNSVVSGPVFGNDAAVSLTSYEIENTTDFKVTGATLQGALDFDGVNDYVQMDHQVIPASGDFTVSLWAKHGSNEAVYQEIISQGNTGNAFYIGKADNGIIRLGDTWSIPSFIFPSDNEWHHYTVVKTASDAHFYFDGILTASKGSTIPNPAGQMFRIGEQYTTLGGEQFEGGVDEIKVWSAALDQAEVLSEINNCEEPLQMDLVAYYPFEETTGSIVYDASQYKNHGTLINMDPVTDWIVNTGLSCGQCSEEAPITVSVSPITPQAVTIDQSNLCTSPGSTDIRVPVTDNDISYYLRTPGNSTINTTPVKGDGNEVVINTGSVAADQTFEVYGAKHTDKYGIEFDGIDDKLLAANMMSFYNNFTYEFWAAPTTTHEIDTEANTGVAGAIGQGRYLVWPNNSHEHTPGGPSGSGLGISVGSNGVSVYEHKTNHLPAVLVYPATITGWNHIAVSCENGLTRLYLNGVLVKTGVATTEPYVYPSIALGGDVYGHYEGGLSEFKLWNYTRSQANIQASMDEHCLKGTENGLALYYPFTEGTGSTVEDYSSSNKDAAFSNTPGLWMDTGFQFDCVGCEVQMSNTVSVTFGDTEAPVPDLASLPDLTDHCSIGISVYPTATDNCGGTIVATTGDPLAYGDQGNFTITWSYVDGNSNMSSQTQTVIIDDQLAPVPNVTNLPTVTGECSATVSETPTASDNCEGTIYGTTTDLLTYSSQGDHVITWSFDDGNNNISTQIQTVSINDTESPVPNLATLPIIEKECTIVAGDIAIPSANDACTGIITGQTTDPLTYSSTGEHIITWSFDDSNGNISMQEQTVKIIDTFAPVPDVASLPLVSEQCSVTLTAPTATDACEGSITATTTDATSYNTLGDYTITWKYTDSEGNFDTQTQNIEVIDTFAPTPELANLPEISGSCSVTVSDVPSATDVCFGIISGTTSDPLTYTAAGDYTITWTYTDGQNNFNTQSQIVTVTADLAPAPDVASLSTVTGNCSVTISDVPTAIDDCDGAINGTTTDPLTYTDEGSYTITWSFVDSKNNTSIQTQTVTVVTDEAPVADLSSLPVITDGCTGSVTVSTIPTATDDCDGIISGTTSDPLTYSTEGSYTITWSYTDSKNNTTTQAQSVNVIVNEAPIPDVVSLSNITEECSASVIVIPTATDNCDGIINGVTSDPLSYTEEGTYVISWSYTNSKNTTSTQSQTVIIEDQTPPVPVLSTLPDIIGTCATDINPPTSIDNCLGTVTGETTDPISYTTAGTYQITWVFNDLNNNSSAQTQNVIISGLDTSVSQNESTLKAEAIGSTFQWLDCDNGLIPISGETNALFQPQIEGSYAVEVTENGCVAISNCFAFSITSTEYEQQLALSIYPMPANEYVLIELNEEISSIRILDLDLKEMKVDMAPTQQGYKLYVQDLAQGIYILVIDIEGNVSSQKIIIE